MGVEKLPIEDCEQPCTHVTLGAFAAPAGQGPFKAGLHQIVGAGAIVRQRQGEAPQTGNQLTQVFVECVHGKRHAWGRNGGID